MLYANSPGYVVEYRGDIVGQLEKVDYACGAPITEKLAVISVDESNLDRLRKDVPAIIFIEARSIYTLQSLSPSNVDNIQQVKVNPYLNLAGRNVIVGIIDTGINYTNPEFIREDGTSRILGLWDQTVENSAEVPIYIGNVYNNKDINAALEAKAKGGNPLDIVPSIDEIGHGTEMAGIIGARGYNGEMEGVANDCDFLVVKLLPSPSYKNMLLENNLPVVPAYNSTEVLSAIEYIRKMAMILKKPLVIYMGVGSNEGSHDGYNITAEYITSISGQSGTIYITGTGNEGNSEGHTSGYIKIPGEVHTVELNVPQFMAYFSLYIWVQKPNRMLLSVISPSGEDTGFFVNQIIAKIKRKFYLVNTELEVFIFDPDYLTGHQLFTLRFTNIKAGIWKFKLQGDLIFNGKYDIWLNSFKLLPKGMKFLKPVVESTLTVPSTARNTISIAYFDGNTGGVLAESGKGFDSNGLIKPDISAPGTDVLTISKSGDKVVTASGSSVAAAIISGVAALFLQWAITDKNDLSLSSIKLRSLLIYAADREEDKEYPNISLGFGKLNAAEVFNVLEGNYRISKFYKNFYEYYFENLFVRLPREIMNKRVERLESIKRETVESISKKDIYTHPEYYHFIVQYSGELKEKYDAPPFVFLTKIDNSFAIISLKRSLMSGIEDTNEVLQVFNKYIKADGIQILYVQPQDIYSLQDISAIESAQVNPIQADVPLGLSGDGVVVGIIDTGIDYLNPEFQDVSGDTRINEIWDQTISGQGAADKMVSFGTVYTKEEINEAIKAARNGKNPYDIVPSRDTNGHGTNMAGVTGAAGKNPELKGMAPNCEFAVVKMTEALGLKSFLGFGDEVSIYNSMAVFSAINYLKEYAIRVKKPLVILLSVGTTNGNHRGGHILDSYIETVVKNVGLILITGTGNQGAAEGHVSGTLIEKGTNEGIEIIIERKQRVFYVGLWIDLPGIADINIISPSGQSTGIIRAVLNQNEKYSFILEKSTVNVYFDLPEKFSGDQLIRMYFYDVNPGNWKIELVLERGRGVKFNGWMWQREIVGEGTRFAPSDPYGTITIPADSDYTIAVAAYNQNNGNTLLYSGVALLGYKLERIDFAAGGVNTLTVGLDNKPAIVNGTSLSAAVGAGICAILFQWGIVQGNYPYMYTQSIKTFLRRGTIQRRGELYPNQQLGFGIINLYKVFEEMT